MRQVGRVFSILYIAALTMIACRGGGTPLGEGPSSRVFDVPANRAITETGMVLSPDTDYRFRHVGGRVCYQGLDRCAPPRGSDVPDDEAWALHLKLGDELIPYRDGMILSVEEEQELVFYLPEGDTEEYDEDKLPLYEDNEGAYRIEVEARPTPQSPGLRPGVVVVPAGADGWCGAGVDEGMKRIAELGARQILLPLPYLTDGKTIWPASGTPRTLCLVRATQTAAAHGLSVAWSVEVDPADRSARADLDPEDRDRFFAAYGELARIFANLAQAEGVALFSPAGGFTALTRTQEDRQRWMVLFLDLHTRFFGTIFYTANRLELAQLDGGFWNTCCDRIGLRPDYSLSEATLPSSQELLTAWSAHMEPLEALVKETGMRMVLVGAPAYPATTACAYRPTEDVPKRIPDEICQVEAYKAWFEAFSPDAESFASDHFLAEIPVVGPPTLLSPLDRLAEEFLVNAWR